MTTIARGKDELGRFKLKEARPPKPPSKARRAAQLRKTQAARAAAPYAAGMSAAAAASFATGQVGLLWFGAGGVAVHAAIRLHEAHGWHRSGGKAAARQRRRYQGWAGRSDLARLSRLGPPDDSTPLILGRAKGRPVLVHRENSALYIGPPGYYKTAALACHAADAPGLLFATSTKTELLLDTTPYRDNGRRRTWILNADGYGNIPNTLSWSPVDGCRNVQTAERRAGAFAKASPRGGVENGSYWADQGAGLIQIALHAAAITGKTMAEVAAWCRNPWADDLTEAYKRPDADPMLSLALASLIGGDGEHMNGIVGAANSALKWVDNPVMRAIASPAPGTGFSPREFARSSDSAYLIGKKRASGSMAPFFAVLATEVFEELKWFAMETPAGCLPVPATFVLDEMPLTCPWAVHDMLAECRGYKITLTMGIQSLSQLRSVWGKDDGDTIRSATPVEVVFGGEKRAEDLEAMSVAIGNRDTWHHVKGPDGRKTRQHATERLMPPEALRNLPKRQAVILAPACKPVLAATPAIWERRGHVRADLSTVFPASEQLALEAPRKPDPIAPPYRAPAVREPDQVAALTETAIDEESPCLASL